jgi:hypothetical protein
VSKAEKIINLLEKLFDVNRAISYDTFVKIFTGNTPGILAGWKLHRFLKTNSGQ